MSAASSVTAHKREGYVEDLLPSCLVLGVVWPRIQPRHLTSRADHTDGRDCCSREPGKNACCVYVYRRQW